MELKGKIKVIFNTQTVGNGFQKREFVVTTYDQYPQQIKFELIKDRCTLLDQYAAGEDVTVHFDIRGREYNEKYFVNLQAWKIVRTETVSSKSAGTDPFVSEPMPASVPEYVTAKSAQEDDLPF